jgi:hypothetical protein
MGNFWMKKKGVLCVYWVGTAGEFEREKDVYVCWGLL